MAHAVSITETKIRQTNNTETEVINSSRKNNVSGMTRRQKQLWSSSMYIENTNTMPDEKTSIFTARPISSLNIATEEIPRSNSA